MAALGSTGADSRSPIQRLTMRQRVFVDAYIRTMNASQAAKEAGYSVPYNVSGAKAKASPRIQAALDCRLAEGGLSIQEVIYRMYRLLDFSMGDFLKVDEKTGKMVFDLKGASEIGAMSIVRKLRHGPKGVLYIEVRDTFQALDRIVKLYDWHGKKSDRPTKPEPRCNPSLEMSGLSS
jgi:hypothetical protein